MNRSVFTIAVLTLALFSPLHGNPEASKQPELLKTVAESGDAVSLFQLGRDYYRGESVPKDEKIACELIEKSANLGNTDAITSMGFFYAQGIGVEKSEAKAVEWFRRGAEKGSATCKLNLGLLLRQGKTIQTSSDESLRLMHEAAEMGAVQAQSYLGQLYFMGDRFLKPDYSKAKPYALKAAEAGDPAAQNIIGILSRDGIGPSAEGHDPAAAEKWFRQAAEQNEVKAQANLAHLMGVASPGSTNRVEALKWLLLAKDREEPTAEKTYNEISPTLPPDLEREARALAARFHFKQAAKKRAQREEVTD
jgi:TPR repeat protein